MEKVVGPEQSKIDQRSFRCFLRTFSDSFRTDLIMETLSNTWSPVAECTFGIAKSVLSEPEWRPSSSWMVNLDESHDIIGAVFWRSLYSQNLTFGHASYLLKILNQNWAKCNSLTLDPAFPESPRLPDEPWDPWKELFQHSVSFQQISNVCEDSLNICEVFLYVKLLECVSLIYKFVHDISCNWKDKTYTKYSRIYICLYFMLDKNHINKKVNHGSCNLWTRR